MKIGKVQKPSDVSLELVDASSEVRIQVMVESC